jgi:hypothetical protein
MVLNKALKSYLKNSIIVCLLLLLISTQHAFGQVFELKQKIVETDLKIISDSVYFFMDRRDVMLIMRQMEKTNKKDYKILIKKMKGVCFEAINLNKIIDDKEISAIQLLMKNEFLFLAVKQKKVAMQYKKSKQFIDKVQLVITDNGNSYSKTLINQILDITGKVIFSQIN